MGIVRDYLPASWVTLVQIKSLYYKGRAHQHAAEALLWFTEDTSQETAKNGLKEDDHGLSNRALEMLQYFHKKLEKGQSDTILDFTMPTSAKERTYLGEQGMRCNSGNTCLLELKAGRFAPLV